MRIDLEEKEFNVAVSRKNAMTTLIQQKAAIEAMVQQSGQAFGEVMLLFAPEGVQLGVLDQIVLGKDHLGYFATIPDPKPPLPVADPGGAPPPATSQTEERN